MKRLFLLLAVAIYSINLTAATYSENNLIFLCFGQSNMQGNGSPEAQDQQGLDTKRFKKMYAADSYGTDKVGKWTSAYPPLCRQGCGLTPADYFGRYLCDSLAEQYKIYVIVVAVAGCSMKIYDKDKNKCKSYIDAQEQWMQNIANNEYGGYPYGRLIDLAKKAQEEVGVIAGILLHQGETDAYSDEWVTNTNNVYRNILKDLGYKAKQVPMLVGEVVNADQNGACAGANNTIKKLCDQYTTIHLISSAGCPAGSDNLHFTPEGYRMLGKRYGEKMFEILKEKGYVTKTSVSPVQPEPAQEEIYNLNGQQLYAPVKGLNIIGGKKYFVVE